MKNLIIITVIAIALSISACKSEAEKQEQLIAAIIKKHLDTSTSKVEILKIYPPVQLTSVLAYPVDFKETYYMQNGTYQKPLCRILISLSEDKTRVYVTTGKICKIKDIDFPNIENYLKNQDIKIN